MSELVERCPKCHATDLWTSWHEDGHACTYGQREKEKTRCCEVGEHLHRGCRNCYFTWRSPVAS